jgi:hypothetical protein
MPRNLARLLAGRQPLPVTAVNSTGYFGNAQRGGEESDGSPDEIADWFRIRILR